MLSDADFPDIFPWMAGRKEEDAGDRSPTASCIARWEDDGGRIGRAGEGRPRADALLAAQPWVVGFAAPALAIATMAIVTAFIAVQLPRRTR